MSRIRRAYTSLSSSSPRAELSTVLQSIIEAGPFIIDDSNRRELIELILKDLSILAKLPHASGKSRLTFKDAPQALLAIKCMGKNPVGSEVLATPTNLSILLSLSSALKDDTEASNEALRCIANALLLVPDARNIFVQKDVGGGEASVELLEKSNIPESIFLASRILFLCTVSIAHSASYIQTLVETKAHGHHPNPVDMIAHKLDGLLPAILGSEKLAREATTDLLKFTFNLLLHYPKIADDSTPEVTASSSDQDPQQKVMGDCWNDRLDSLLAPLLRLFNSLPPTFPPLAAPMTHVIHALITIPVTPSLHNTWYPPTPKNMTPPLSKSPSPSNSPESPTGAHPPSRGSSPIAKDPKPGALDRAFSRLSAGRRSNSRSSSPLQSNHDTLQRVHDLLDVTLSHYLPGDIDPDEASVRDRCSRESDSTLDDIACPLVLLVTKLCFNDEASRKRMRQWILPDDLDRTSPLEGRSDMLGRCLRLMGCVHHPRLKDSVGEMLFAICDSDGSTLASYVGYGNVAGFLFNKGIMSAPPRSATSTAPTTTTSGVPIDPITGVEETEKPLIEMTDEEKEREAEKLFVLFDRLERSGAIPPSQNPIRKAAQEGKLG